MVSLAGNPGSGANRDVLGCRAPSLHEGFVDGAGDMHAIGALQGPAQVMQDGIADALVRQPGNGPVGLRDRPCDR